MGKAIACIFIAVLACACPLLALLVRKPISRDNT